MTILKLLTGAQLTGLAGTQHLCCGRLEIPGSGGKTVSAGDRDKRDDWYKQGGVWHVTMNLVGNNGGEVASSTSKQR